MKKSLIVLLVLGILIPGISLSFSLYKHNTYADCEEIYADNHSHCNSRGGRPCYHGFGNEYSYLWEKHQTGYDITIRSCRACYWNKSLMYWMFNEGDGWKEGRCFGKPNYGKLDFGEPESIPILEPIPEPIPEPEPEPEPIPELKPTLDVQFSNQLMTLINGQRVNRDLPKIFVNSILRISTTNKIQDMRINNYFAHLSPSGKQFYNFITELSYNYSVAAEILAKDYQSEQAFVTAWMNSPGHKTAILGEYEDFSCSYIKPLAVCHFTRRVEEPPPTPEPLPTPEPEPESPTRTELMTEIIRIMTLLQELMSRLINLMI